MTCDGIREAIKRRKRDMLESALRDPCTSSTASASRVAAGPEHEACAREKAEQADHLYVDIPVRTADGYHRWGKVEWCILTMLWANEITAGGLSSWLRAPHPDADLLASDEEAADRWRWAFTYGVLDGFVMGREAVARAIAQWDHSKNTGEGRASEWATPEAEHLTRVVRAAVHKGEGVIVHGHVASLLFSLDAAEP